jgi:DNA-binding NtrC family response regulator
MAMIQRCGGDPSAAYDLVLSDIRMPGKSGYEVFAAVKDVDADCPVILMTGFGYDPSHSIIRARREGLAAVLFKPFKVDQLLSEIRRAISR